MAGGIPGLGGHVIDMFLAGAHARNVVAERLVLRLQIRVGGREAQELGDPVPVGRILGNAFLQYLAELGPAGLVLGGIGLRQLRQHVQSAAGDAGAHRLDFRVILQQLARDVQRQVRGIDHALQEAQVVRQELLGIVEDEDALDVQLQASRRVAVPQIERCPRRHVKQSGVLALAFDAVMRMRERRGRIVADVLVELGVFLVGDLRPRPGPQRRGRVHGVPVVARPFLAHAHRKGDVIGVAAHQGPQAPRVRVLLGVVAQVQHDPGADRIERGALDGEVALAGRLPAHAGLGRVAGAAAVDLDPAGDNERGVEADAELADQLGVLGLVAAQVGQELGRAGLGDGAELGDDILAVHADPGIGHRHRRRIGVELDVDGHRLGAERGLGKRPEPALVAGIRGVGNQFAEEDLPIGVERVDHHPQQLADLGLEAEGFTGRAGRHEAILERSRNGRQEAGGRACQPVKLRAIGRDSRPAGERAGRDRG